MQILYNVSHFCACEGAVVTLYIARTVVIGNQLFQLPVWVKIETASIAYK